MPAKIRNPATGRMVEADGAIGRAITAALATCGPAPKAGAKAGAKAAPKKAAASPKTARRSKWIVGIQRAAGARGEFDWYQTMLLAENYDGKNFSTHDGPDGSEVVTHFRSRDMAERFIAHAAVANRAMGGRDADLNANLW